MKAELRFASDCLTTEPILIEVNSLEDLLKIIKSYRNEIVVDYNDEDELEIIVYDDYLE